jgi:hypothetical protein
MDRKIFRNIIDKYSQEIGFQRKWNAWIKETNETTIALILRKSGYSNSYYLRIKINLSDSENIKPEIEKNWIKHDIAEILLSFDSNHLDLFDLENNLSDDSRENDLQEIFHSELKQLIERLSTKKGIIEWSKMENMFLLPYTKRKLGL